MGWLMGVLVHPANQSDKIAAKWLLKRIPFQPRWRKFLLDGGYRSPSLAHWCEQLFGVTVEFTARPKSFAVQPQRWVVERTFGWLNRFRRLSKDYEQRPDVSEGYVYLAMIHLMLRRLCR